MWGIAPLCESVPRLALWPISFSSPWSSPLFHTPHQGFEDLLAGVQQKQDAHEALLFGHTFDSRTPFEEKHSWPLTWAIVTSHFTLVLCILWPKNEPSEENSHRLKGLRSGDAGDRTQDLIHAKHTLYHWATSPPDTHSSMGLEWKPDMTSLFLHSKDEEEAEMLQIEPRIWRMQSTHSAKAGFFRALTLTSNANINVAEVCLICKYSFFVFFKECTTSTLEAPTINWINYC